MSTTPKGVRKTVLIRAQGNCERCGRNLANVPSSVHHRRPRGMGGSKDPAINDPEACVVLCGSGTTGCHGDIESNREQAIEHGWLVPRRDPRHPREVPVFIAGGWYLIEPTLIVPVDLSPPF